MLVRLLATNSLQCCRPCYAAAAAAAAAETAVLLLLLLPGRLLLPLFGRIPVCLPVAHWVSVTRSAGRLLQQTHRAATPEAHH
jgi:hypothetical protein